jgi:polyphosphate kinase 2 (PPK2 family)
MYFQRYMGHLPAAGEIVIFDRSWYNRAGVVLESGIVLLKYWLEMSIGEQERRLRERIRDGRKLWMLSPMDLKSFSRWDEYTRARDEMFAATDTEAAPWFVVRSDDKRRARLNCISHLLSRIPYRDVTGKLQKVKLPKRRKTGYREARHAFRFVPEKY